MHRGQDIGFIPNPPYPVDEQDDRQYYWQAEEIIQIGVDERRMPTQ